MIKKRFMALTCAAIVLGGGLFAVSCDNNLEATQTGQGVRKVTVTPATANVGKGGSRRFTAEVEAPDGVATSVIWSVTGNADSGTSIAQNGVLTVGMEEAIGKILKVTAQSIADSTKSGTASVTVTEVGDKEIIDISIDPKTVSVTKGQMQQFTVFVEVAGGADQTVEWSIAGNTENTTIDRNQAGALLTVFATEPADSLTVTVKSTFDPTKSATAAVTLVTPPPAVSGTHTVKFDSWMGRAQGGRDLPTPALINARSVIVPPSNAKWKNLRNYVAAIYAGDTKTDLPVLYEVQQLSDGAWGALDADLAGAVSVNRRGMLEVTKDALSSVTSATPSAQRSRTVRVVAKSVNGEVSAQSQNISILKKFHFSTAELKDVEGNASPEAGPLGQSGYTLYYASEFNGDQLDAAWQPYYLSGWAPFADTTADYRLDKESGYLYITAKRELTPWNLRDDGTQRISGIQTYDRGYLHRFGYANAGREMPVFDGLATKFGYYELRFKFPNTGDGGHFAWWMIGTQEDSHPTITVGGTPLADQANDIWKPGFGGGWDNRKFSWTNQGSEYDIVEQYIDATTSGYRTFLPVLHRNGSMAVRYWYANGVANARKYGWDGANVDPYNEFHVYGFNWDPEGVQWYIDGKLVYDTVNEASDPNRAAYSNLNNDQGYSANYRMLSILSLYPGKENPAQGGFGQDAGIYPKEAIIDYLRIYKRTSELDKPTSIEIMNAPYYLQKPASGNSSYTINVRLLDLMDRPINDPAMLANLKWQISSTIEGLTAGTVPGVSVNNQGVVTVTSAAAENADVFLTCYLDTNIDNAPARMRRGVRETRHIKVSSAQGGAANVRLVAFDAPRSTPAERRVKSGSRIDVTATAYDQYRARTNRTLTYSVKAGIAENDPIASGGVITQDGDKRWLTVTGSPGTVIVVNARTTRRINPDVPAEFQIPGYLGDLVMANMVLTVE